MWARTIMDDSKIISGVIVPTLTFFEEDGAIGKKANEALILHLIENSVNVIFVLGSTGEGLYFKSKPQKKREYLQWLKGALLKHD